MVDLQNLVNLPTGCGEQNMIHFAPHVSLLLYLHHTGHTGQGEPRAQQGTETHADRIRETAAQALVQGYQRQLTYRREDGAYSAFGQKDAEGNMW